MGKKITTLLILSILPFLGFCQIELKSDFIGYNWTTFQLSTNTNKDDISIRSNGIYRFKDNEIHVLTIPSDTVVISINSEEYCFISNINPHFNPLWTEVNSLENMPTGLIREEVNAIRYYFSLYFLNNTLPRFENKDINGNIFSNNELNGKITIMSFWFYGCAPCKAVIPELNHIKKKFSHDETIQFWAFSADKEIMHPEMFDFHHFPKSKSIGDDFLVFGYPRTFLLDKDGIVRDVFIGASIDDNLYLRENMIRRIIEIKNGK